MRREPLGQRVHIVLDDTRVGSLHRLREQPRAHVHSITTHDVTGIVPTRAIPEHLGLRGLHQTFDMAETSGTLASRSLAAPAGYKGRLLYLRADLLEHYTRETDTEMGWVIWGERELGDDWHDPPEWYRQLRLADGDQHRRIVSLSELN